MNPYIWDGDKVKQGRSGEHWHRKCHFWKTGEENLIKKRLFERGEARGEPWSLVGHIKCAIPIRQSSGGVRWMGVGPEIQEAQKSLAKSSASKLDESFS